MTRREEVLRLIELKRQAIRLLTKKIKGHRADIQSLNMELREIDYAEAH